MSVFDQIIQTFNNVSQSEFITLEEIRTLSGVASGAATELSYPSDTSKVKNFMVLKASRWESANVPSASTNTVAGAASVLLEKTESLSHTIALPIPQSLPSTYNHTWRVEEGVTQINADDLKDLLGAGEQLLSERLATSTQKSAIVSEYIKKTQQTTGVAINPRLGGIFGGTQLRTFSFDFHFAPKSHEEMKEVLAILMALKWLAASGRGDASDISLVENTPIEKLVATGISSIPSVFEIEFRFDNGSQTRKNDSLYVIKPAAITNVSIVYNPQNVWATFKNGAPVQFSATIDFIELEAIDRNKIYNGY